MTDRPPVVFVHGNGDSASIWQNHALALSESNGWFARAIVCNRTSPPAGSVTKMLLRPDAPEHMEHLRRGRAELRDQAKQVILIWQFAVWRHPQFHPERRRCRGQPREVSAASPNHGVWAIEGFREGMSSRARGPFCSSLNAPKNAAGDE